MATQEGTEVLDAVAVEDPVPSPGASQAVVPATPPPALAVAPQASAKDLVARLDAIKEAQKEAMEKDVDYGVIPGTDKPTLFKPGAEKLAALFQLDVQPSNEKRWEEGGHLTVVSRVTIFHAPTGARLGSGEGICSTREKKYGKRTANLKCPECEKEAVFRSKHPPRDNPDADPGWFCWAKKGGCGANFEASDERITGQERGEIDNPDLADLWNTVDKMATKRALVAAVLIVTGASAVFTQDVEDMPGAEADTGSNGNGQQQKQQARPKLDAERVTELGKGIGQVGLSYKAVHMMLGAVGADGIREESSQGIRSALEALTPDQADAFAARLNAAAEEKAAEAGQEGGES